MPPQTAIWEDRKSHYLEDYSPESTRMLLRDPIHVIF